MSESQGNTDDWPEKLLNQFLWACYGFMTCPGPLLYCPGVSQVQDFGGPGWHQAHAVEAHSAAPLEAGQEYGPQRKSWFPDGRGDQEWGVVGQVGGDGKAFKS